MITIQSKDESIGYLNLRFLKSRTYENRGLSAAAYNATCMMNNRGVNAGLITSTCDCDNSGLNMSGLVANCTLNKGINMGLLSADCGYVNEGLNIGGIMAYCSENKADNLSLFGANCRKVKSRTVAEAMPTFTKWGLVPKKLRDKKFPSTNMGLITETDNPQGAFIGGYLGGFSLLNYIDNREKGQYLAAGLINVVKDEKGYHVSPFFSANIKIRQTDKPSKLETGAQQ